MRGTDLRHAIYGNIRRVTRQSVSETHACWLQTLVCLVIHHTHGKIIVKCLFQPDKNFTLTPIKYFRYYFNLNIYMKEKHGHFSNYLQCNTTVLIYGDLLGVIWKRPLNYSKLTKWKFGRNCHVWLLTATSRCNALEF